MADETQATEKVAEKEAEVKTEAIKTEAEEEMWKDGEKFDAAKAQQLIAKLRGKVRELEPKAKKADELAEAENKRKEAEMTELQKAQKLIDDLTAKTKAADLRELRRKVGEEAKLPAAIYELLPEMDEDAMKAKAKELAAALPKPQPGLSPTNPGGNSEETLAEKKARLMPQNTDFFSGNARTGVIWPPNMPER